MRLGDVELRKLIGSNADFEIIKWDTNQYFGMESSYTKIDEHTYSDGMSKFLKRAFLIQSIVMCCLLFEKAYRNLSEDGQWIYVANTSLEVFFGYFEKE